MPRSPRRAISLLAALAAAVTMVPLASTIAWSQEAEHRGFLAIGPAMLLIWETGQPRDRGAAIAIDGGYRFSDHLSLVAGGSVTHVEHAQISAGYQHWQTDLGLRLGIPVSARLQPFLGGGISLQTGRRDREGRAPVPDHIGAGGHLSVGLDLSLSRRLGIVAVGDYGQTWLNIGRVENGDWVRATGGSADVDFARGRIQLVVHL